MSFLINTPPTLDGDNAAKILQLYKHLYKMSEEVNYALNALAKGNVVDLTGTTQARQTFATAMTGGTIGGTDAPSLQSYNELKSLIIKTGNAIKKSMTGLEIGFGKDISRIDGNIGTVQKLIEEVSQTADDITDSINSLGESIYGEGGTVESIERDISGVQTDIATNASDILANKTEISGLKEINMELSNAFGVGSEYGSYAEAISNKMSVSAKNVIQEYEIISRLDSADEKATGFAEWINVTDSYIKTGILYNDSETGLEQVGIAIGTNISTSIVDGVVQPNATKTDLLATFVSDALIFWQQGRKVAYLSNKKLYILSAEFLGSYRIGDFQWVNADVGLILEWIGD